MESRAQPSYNRYRSYMKPDLSVVVPLFNEEPNLLDLHRELSKVLTAWGRPYEIILVDDGSTDGTFSVLADIQSRDMTVRVIRLRKNFGQTAAFAAGFAHARGTLIATSDGDLQNDPADLPAMVDKIDEGYDIVCGWRKERKDAWLTRRLVSNIANSSKLASKSPAPPVELARNKRAVARLPPRASPVVERTRSPSK